MERKYELTEETMTYDGRKIHRIKALINFDDVREGDLGGWVESEENLSQEGDCWIYDDAKAISDSRVSGDAKLRDCAVVSGAAIVRYCAEVSDRARISGNAIIWGYAKVSEKAFVYENAKVDEAARVHGWARVFGNAHITDAAEVFDHAEVYDSAWIADSAIVYSAAIVDGSAHIGVDAEITDERDYLVIGPIGSRNDDVTFYKTKEGILVYTGCFNDTLDEFKDEVLAKHEGSIYKDEYLLAIEFAKKILGDKKHEE